MLACITTSCNFAASWIKNIEVVNFFKTFLPPAKIPSHHKLTHKIIPMTNLALHAEAQADVKGMHVTLQGDGFTGINHHHLLALMITADRKVCLANYCITLD